MDPSAFDALARAFSAAGSRRQLLRRLATLPLVGALVVVGEKAAAERPLARLQRRTPQRNRKQRNTKDKGNNGKGKGKVNVGRPLDCPDATINCFATHNENCQDVVGQIGPVGRCGHGLSCCPCESSDQGYWNNRCNQEVSACNGACFAQDEGIFSCFACQV